MTILCIETSTSVCSAAICKDGAPVKQCISYEGSNHARLLPRYIEELLSFAREQALCLDAVALSEGPGSYTGLRIGASTAKGLCYGLNIPLIPIPTLEVLCEAAREKIPCIHARLSAEPAVLVPMLDARRMEVYTAIFDSESKVESTKSKEQRVRAVVVENEESVLSQQAQPVACALSAEGGLAVEQSYFYFGDGAAKCAKIFTKPNWHFIPNIVPEAQFMGALVESRKMISGAELAYYEPFYLKEFIAAPSHVKGLN
ncbi:MAG: tRNA (adenosine(37)-N6)-threonylcarbamoyltransferase complex dimerization subunit type 1 TsaB, partial [Paludibacteraceae bacterium]|nr:tRNA (adenosine(37)-N6)-threonylcarbamoyltransferase complex dimerization subunit type 1 TsaB [Paludibacteraceae bacterium]